VKLELPIPKKLENFFDLDPSKDFNYTDHEHRDVWVEWFNGAKITPDFQFSIVRNPHTRWDSQMWQLHKNPAYQYQNGTGVLEYVDRVYYTKQAFTWAVFQFITPGIDVRYAENREFHGTKGFGDNHYRPQTEFISLNGEVLTKIYKYEEGIDSIVKNLKERKIIDSHLKPRIKNSKPVEIRSCTPWKSEEYQQLNLYDKFKDYYKEDFQKLNYNYL
tara:strand:+ start:2216 stop:2866 length:651 start_codon:yes stop_codon:yes gene_type:complete